MNRRAWLLMLAAGCQGLPEPAALEPGVVRQPVNSVPGVTAVVLAAPDGGLSDQFGHALAVGDFNGDGRLDLAVGAPGAEPNGKVFVFYGPLTPASRPSVLEPTAVSGAKFGTALLGGDLNGDSVSDLLVGAPAVNGRGRVYVYRGAKDGGPPFLPSGAGIVDPLGIGANAGFGASFAYLKSDRVAVGAPGDDAGSVVLYGLGPALVNLGALHGSAPGDRFGAALLGIDLDHVGGDDLLIGAPRASGSKGEVTLCFADAGLGYEVQQKVVGALQEQAGTALFLVGATGRVAVSSTMPSSEGRVELMTLGTGGTLVSGASLQGAPLERLGSSYALADLDGDTASELYVGAPGSGQVYAFNTGPTPTPTVGGVTLGANAANSSFGCAMETGNLLLGGGNEVAVGAETFAYFPGAIAGGAVFVFQGVIGIPFDGGVAFDGGSADAGQPLRDAGTGDGGANARDGGAADAGRPTEEDAGSEVRDGGAAATDAGADAGADVADAGEHPSSLQFVTEPCGCASPVAGPLLLLAGLLLRRARRLG